MNIEDPLDQLAKAGDPTLGWCCRDSTTGRGLRLHQITQESAEYWGMKVFATPREALLDYLASRGSGA